MEGSGKGGFEDNSLASDLDGDVLPKTGISGEESVSPLKPSLTSQTVRTDPVQWLPF